jgi:hypothetical protein
MDKTIHTKLISRCCWQALVIAVLALLVFPETFSSSSLLGQTWLWLIATPLSTLIVIHRHHFAAAWSTVLVNSSSRRRRQTPQWQARRKGFGRASLRQTPQRAA